ncbi:hypothetical protein SADUNF_Sadunf10G0005500 [Salix dunnii]|uniref:Uncharacterized protein n=1 Tax=Salix dunnii TaxID=1413687 RepID=A0A835JP11_9ROSI|nr:hypothetical protein SADUNF_Sadunf10G0005500 [Salix dunnii]
MHASLPKLGVNYFTNNKAHVDTGDVSQDHRASKGWWLGGEVEFGFITTDALRGFIISFCGFLSCVVSAQPNSNTFVWVSYFGCPFSPWPLPYSSVHVLSGSLSLLVTSSLLYCLAWPLNFLCYHYI